MKANYVFIIIFLMISRLGFAQTDTITGILLDVNEKIIKKHPVTLGKVSPVTVKSDKYGIFMFPNANLNDTLYIGDKKGKNPIAIPINGYAYITVKSLKGDFHSTYLSEPDRQLLRSLQQMENDRNNAVRSKTYNFLSKEDIKLRGCPDIECLMRAFAGVSVVNGEVQILGNNNSRYNSTAALILINGIPTRNLSNIPVESIESIRLIKDGRDYGLQGQNGVVEITMQGGQ